MSKLTDKISTKYSKAQYYFQLLVAPQRNLSRQCALLALKCILSAAMIKALIQGLQKSLEMFCIKSSEDSSSKLNKCHNYFVRP